ncbi:alpha,alpha-trehalose-phosphate synthase [UDP-forming] 1-like protein isoform X2 [Tanacetum coccineum]
MMMPVKIQDIYNLKDEMMDMTDISNDIQESLGKSYSVPDDIDEDDHLGDVALITCLRDEMNLVSEEFVGCQALKKGVFIISEFAGATQSFSAGAPLVNPWNATEVGHMGDCNHAQLMYLDSYEM